MPRKSQGKAIKKGNGLGHSLGASRKKTFKNRRFTKQEKMAEFAMRHVTEIKEEESNLNSITERNDLDEFLTNALLAEVDFHKESGQRLILEGPQVVTQTVFEEIYDYDIISIPRRPKWVPGMSASELFQKENSAYLLWRAELNALDHKSTRRITPFEKNIEVWKQLWRVVERCEVLVQIIDARNPALFRSPDLEQYVREVGVAQNTGKTCLLVVNKSDFLSPMARKMWADYFKAQGIEYVFFSAVLEQRALEEKVRAERDAEQDMEAKLNFEDEQRYLTAGFAEVEDKYKGLGLGQDVVANTTTEEGDEETTTTTTTTEAEEEEQETAVAVDPVAAEVEAEAATSSSTGVEGKTLEEQEEEVLTDETLRLLTRVELIAHLTQMAIRVREEAKKNVKLTLGEKTVLDNRTPDDRYQIGFIGYPNVGKSSTINVLMGEKKVSVAATPGHTKTFQTLNLGDEICLCDCPGLVFPTFMSSKADQVLNGIFPIDQYRQTHEAINLLCQRIPLSQFDQFYGVQFPKDTKLNHEILLGAIGRMWGFMKDHGRVDDSRAGRVLLKDYVGGKLLYCNPPPHLDATGRASFGHSFIMNHLSQVAVGKDGKRLNKAFSDNVLIDVDVSRKKRQVVNFVDVHSVENIFTPGGVIKEKKSRKQLRREAKLAQKIMKQGGSRNRKSTREQLRAKNQGQMKTSSMQMSVMNMPKKTHMDPRQTHVLRKNELEKPDSY